MIKRLQKFAPGRENVIRGAAKKEVSSGQGKKSPFEKTDTLCYNRRMKKIYLIRHGETESNRKGIFRGRLDIPLSPNGREQAADLKRYFENIPVDIVYTSPLQRAVETAETVFPGHTPVKEKWLNNLDLGEWSGMEKAIVKERSPEMWEDWVKRPESIRFPGGERLWDVHKRMSLFLGKVAYGDDEIVAAVSHRSVLKVLIAFTMGMEKKLLLEISPGQCVRIVASSWR